jgi:hypothetical protein
MELRQGERRYFHLAFALWFVIAAPSSSAGRPVPAEAKAVIRQVQVAAAARDFAALEALMVPGFVWSFGGDESAQQALAAWKTEPRVLDRLSRATKQACRAEDDGIVECPTKAGTGYRAGFQRTAHGWRMIYFVAGE